MLTVASQVGPFSQVPHLDSPSACCLLWAASHLPGVRVAEQHTSTAACSLAKTASELARAWQGTAEVLQMQPAHSTFAADTAKGL